jgi:hypothetical protein
MPRYFCHECGRETQHLNVSRSAEVAQVTRATIYNWLHREQVHCLVRPSGRKFICIESLVRPPALFGRALSDAGGESFPRIAVR